jgi:hypothetical protein
MGRMEWKEPEVDASVPKIALPFLSAIMGLREVKFMSFL